MDHVDAPRISMCTRCEKELTGRMVQAFNRGGYKVDLEYCLYHIFEWIDERLEKGLCISCDSMNIDKHDRGCTNENKAYNVEG